jgi:NAD+ synthase
MKEALEIILAQINPVLGDIPYNLEKISKIINDNKEDTDLIVFPEMAVCGYPPEDLILKSSFLRRIENEINKFIKKTDFGGCAVILPAPIKESDKTYNAALFIEDNQIKQVIKKQHLPNYGVFDEQRLFYSDSTPCPVEFKGRSLGIMVCEDMWYENVSAELKDKGAEILISVNASPFELSKHNKRKEYAAQRSKETGLPLLYVNQCGGQDELVFDGGSFIMDGHGSVISHLNFFTEATLNCIWDDKNLSSSAESEQEEPLLAIIYKAALTGLKDYVEKNGFSGVILGLSGGIDSALSAAIAVDALGADKVHCVMMPSIYTSDESLDDAKKCAEKLSTRYDVISIEEPVKSFESTLETFFDKNTPETTFENIQPRARGLILMALSNASGKMVLSTGNKSEMAVGYATLYGDMCGGFNPLKDLYKTQVYDLSRWRNKNKPDIGLGPPNEVIPDNIITKAPTAELKPNQTDQDSLPSYDELDSILELLIEDDLGFKEITDLGYDKKTVLKIWKLLDRAEYKRRQAPPGVKITSRAFGKDRRYPITNRFVKFIENAS